MSVIITREDIRAYAEVDYIIKHLNKKYVEKVPSKLLTFFEQYKDPTINLSIDPYIPLDKQGLQTYTLEILALLHLKYWCESDDRKKELYEMMRRNQELIEEKLGDKFEVEDVFDLGDTVLDNKKETNKNIENEEDLEDEYNIKAMIKKEQEQPKGLWAKIKKVFLDMYYVLKNKK